MSDGLDFFFFYGSTYTYLAVMRIERLASTAGVALRWRPFNVRAIMIEQNNIPFRGKPVKTTYMWRDLERRAARHGIAFVKPPPYPVDPEGLAARVGVLAAEEGWCPAYTKATYRAWFLEDKAPGEPQHLASILRGLDKDPDKVVESANSQRVKDKYEAETDVARRLGIFGSPTFVVGGEIFWGDDRLEDALDWAQSQRVGERVG
ncbi:MAG TPA: 2-hydroxychromene-2-carboxylate isomerase [Stellaceae bacterium]|nr:2-hydroxychromene-2-carboxylate isomerase [Stellaceae bacterium]